MTIGPAPMIMMDVMSVRLGMSGSDQLAGTGDALRREVEPPMALQGAGRQNNGLADQPGGEGLGHGLREKRRDQAPCR